MNMNTTKKNIINTTKSTSLAALAFYIISNFFPSCYPLPSWYDQQSKIIDNLRTNWKIEQADSIQKVIDDILEALSTTPDR